MSPVRLKEQQQVLQEETQEGQFQQEPLYQEEQSPRLKATGSCDESSRTDCCMLGYGQDGQARHSSQRPPEEPDFFWVNSGGDELPLVARLIN